MIGLASIRNPMAQGIAIIMLNLVTMLILLCTCFLLPVCTVVTRLGIKDAASALDTDNGTLTSVLYWLLKIPMKLAYSVF